ncbi:MAG TPA: DUF86 domain-containing protein [Leptospiraceae bacterium]|nr:DUF86 domain-containing protein [Leptospiraceae bacterium]HNI96989.1 DUF86 domain-containing protein [Leptospiraceae bacterium]HNN06658.1 DUF86 domain-containing protein [Leptospiraceae bacterium]HNO25815.1 DUF86 domain-containing protein [Leptospiraceae bacterium]
MKKEERNVSLYLTDMEEAIQNILNYTEGISFEEFKKSRMIQDAVIRNFEVMGEAANRIPETVKNQYTEIPWADMYGLRNRIAHEYFGIDFGIIWKITKDFLPDNLKRIQRIKSSLFI